METDKIANKKKNKRDSIFYRAYLCSPLDEQCTSCVFYFFAVTKKAPKKTQHPLARLFETGAPKQTIKKKKEKKTKKHTYSRRQSRGDRTSRSAKVESKKTYLM